MRRARGAFVRVDQKAADKGSRTLANQDGFHVTIVSRRQNSRFKANWNVRVGAAVPGIDAPKRRPGSTGGV
jgi:hypothetical protein